MVKKVLSACALFSPLALTQDVSEASYSLEVCGKWHMPYHPTQCRIIQHSAVSSNTVPYHPTQCRIIQHSAVSSNTVPFHPTQCRVIQHSVVSFNAVPYHPTQCRIIQHSAVSSNAVPYHPTQCRIIQHSAVSSSNRLASPEIQLKVLKDAHKWKSSYFIKRKCSKNLSLIYHCKKRVSLPLFLPLIAPLRSWCFYLPTLFLCSSPSLSPHPLSPPCLLFIKQDALLRRSDLISPLHCLLFAYQAGFPAKPFTFYQAGRVTP